MTTAVAAIAVFGVTRIVAQSSPQGGRAAASRDIVIQFTVGPAGCTDRTRVYAVTMRIYNVLAQPVGIPALVAHPESDPIPAGAEGRALNKLMLPCGRYAAIWNGRHVSTGRRLAPGVYLYDLFIDGQRLTRKITLER
ncbi:MAG: hypothetical protein ABR499_03660 [Gemmatimonadaceae bacterium]